MTSAQPARLAFAGVASVIGPFVMGLFWLLGALGLVGVAISLAAGKIAADADGLGGLAILAIVVGALTWVMRRDLRAIRTITCEPDGGWTLRNPLGIRLGSIAAAAPRTVRVQQRKVWMFANSASRYTQSWVEIEADGRTWRTCANIPVAQAQAIAALRRPPFSG